MPPRATRVSLQLALSRRADAARGEEIYAYNAFEELTSVTHPAANETREFFYDVLGRLERIEDKDGTTTWTYDGSGPNEIGALVETLSPTGVRTLYGYEPPLADQNRGLLARITRQVGGLEPLVTQMSYDEFARP